MREASRMRGRKEVSLRRKITGIALLLAIPLTLLGALTLEWIAGSYQRDYQQKLGQAARGLALALDQEVEAYIGLLLALSESPLLDSGDFPAFAEQAEVAATAVNSFVLVFDPALRRVASAGNPGAAPAVPLSPVRRVFESGELQVGGLTDRGPGEGSVVIYVPAIRDGRAVFVLAMPLEAASLIALMEGLAMEERTVAVLSDQADRIIAHSLEQERLAGSAVPDWLSGLRREADTGVAIGPGPDGGKIQVAYASLTKAGWNLAVVEPYSKYRSRWLTPVLAIAAVGTLLLLLVLIAVWRLTLHLLRPIEQLARTAQALADGRSSVLEEGARPTGVREYDALYRSLLSAQRALQREAEAHQARAVAEAELAVGESFFRAVPLPMAMRSSEGLFVKVNDAFCRLVGRSAKEVLGRSPRQLFPAAVLERMADLEARLAQSPDQVQVLEVEWPAAADPERARRIQIRKALVREPHGSGGPRRGVVSVLLDVTEERLRQQELEQQAATDPLTGIANRRAFLQRLGTDRQQARPAASPLSLILFDLDNFKQVNDRFGHQAGDQILRVVVSLVREHLREDSDLFARIGGEEFAILVPSGRSQALEIAERLRRAVDRAPALSLEAGFKVTASFGVADLDPAKPGQAAAAEALDRADAALYRAKDLGRNRVVAAD